MKVFERAREIGVAGDDTGVGFLVDLVADVCDGHRVGPVGEVFVLDPHGDGRTERFTMANTTPDFGSILLDLHAAAGAVAFLATRHLLFYIVLIDGQSGGYALHYHGQSGAVGFARGEISEVGHQEVARLTASNISSTGAGLPMANSKPTAPWSKSMVNPRRDLAPAFATSLRNGVIGGAYTAS